MSDITQTTIEVYAEEKVGLPNYSNVTIGHRISRTYVGPVDELTLTREIADEVEAFVAEERQAILASVQGK